MQAAIRKGGFQAEWSLATPRRRKEDLRVNNNAPVRKDHTILPSNAVVFTETSGRMVRHSYKGMRGLAK